jgi:phosphate butyryltransferase
MYYKNFDEITKAVLKAGEKKKMAVVAAHDIHALESVTVAEDQGIVIPILIGIESEIKSLLAQLGKDAEAYKIIDCEDIHEAARIGVRLVREDEAQLLMKAKLETGQILKAVVDKENGLGKGRLMSFISINEVTWYHKLIFISDGGMVLYPTTEEKIDIIQNAVDALHNLGYDNPKVGILAAVEKVNPKMPETVEADELKQLNLAGKITGCVVEGPISFDIATIKENAEEKGFVSEVAGDVDLLIVPNIHTGNMLGKALVAPEGAKMAGLILGAQVPIVMTSRSASSEEKLLSITLGAAMS